MRPELPPRQRHWLQLPPWRSLKRTCPADMPVTTPSNTIARKGTADMHRSIASLTVVPMVLMAGLLAPSLARAQSTCGSPLAPDSTGYCFTAYSEDTAGFYGIDSGDG